MRPVLEGSETAYQEHTYLTYLYKPSLTFHLETTKEVTFHSPATTEVEPESLEDGSDVDSTCAEVGTSDDDIDDLASPIEEHNTGTCEKTMSTTDESSDAAPEWTRKEDRIICVMKSAAKS